MMRILAAVMLITAASGCASRGREGQPGDPGFARNVGDASESSVSQTGSGLTDAALSPLGDLNLRRKTIPPVLAAMDSPYPLEPDLSCEQVIASLAELDAVIGPDWDTRAKDEALRSEKLAHEASDAALGAVESGATGWIPFRGLVRKATGAESHEKKFSRAFQIGAQRRTYLKGYGLAKGCERPARPDFETLLKNESSDTESGN